MTDSIQRCLVYGINFFDTAEVYGAGLCDTFMGNAFKELNVKRENIVVTAKIFWESFDLNNMPVNSIGLSRKHIIEGLRNSLKRL